MSKSPVGFGQAYLTEQGVTIVRAAEDSIQVQAVGSDVVVTVRISDAVRLFKLDPCEAFYLRDLLDVAARTAQSEVAGHEPDRRHPADGQERKVA